MGGVVNIITKTDYDGMHLSVNGSRPTQGGLEKSGIALTVGKSDEKSSIMLVLEQQNASGLRSGDRDNIDHMINTKRGSNRYQPYGYYFTNDGEGNKGPGTPGPNCPKDLIVERSNGFGCIGDYEQGAVYIPDTKRTSIFTRYSQSMGDELEFYAQGLYVRDLSVSKASWLGIWGEMEADNVNNPTAGSADPQRISYRSVMGRNRSFDWEYTVT